jgi:very-short-patch-repair endonuclease
LHVRTWDQILVEIGFDALQRGLEAGTIVPLGSDWFGTASTPESTKLALRCGARETCMSALDHHGVWVPPYQDIHLTSPRGRLTPSGRLVLQEWATSSDTNMASPSQVVASAAEISVDETAENATDNEGEDRVESPGRERFTPPEGVVFHPGLRRWSDDGPVVPVPVALAQAGRCADPLDTLIVFESVLRQGLVGREQLEAIQASFPAHVRRTMGRIRSDAGSGTETKVRRALELEKVDVTSQWYIDGVGRVDLLVGECLVIECDSRAHHTGEAAYQRDRRRDQILADLGYYYVRLTWEQVFLEWEATLAYLRGLIASKRHRIRRSKRLGRATAHWSELDRRRRETDEAEAVAAERVMADAEVEAASEVAAGSVVEVA